MKVCIRHIIITLALLVSCALQGNACQPKTGTEPQENGIFIDGEKVCALEGATCGGSIANPRAGRSTRVDLYAAGRIINAKSLKAGAPKANAAVSIRGYEYYGKKYKKPGSSVNSILVDCEKTGNLALTLDQGRYRSSNPKVRKICFGTHECSGGNCHTFIEILLKDGRTVTIRYNGSSLPDRKR